MEALHSLLQQVNDVYPDDVLSQTAREGLRGLAKELGLEVLVENYDSEQVWGQLDFIVRLMQNSKAYRELSQVLSNTHSFYDIQASPSPLASPDHPQETASDKSSAGDFEPRDGLEDEFLKLDEMHQFVDEAEADNEDLALSVSDSDGASYTSESKYYDFFKDPKAHESEEEQEQIFNTELFRQMDRLEDEMVGDKPWALKGETKSSSRPVNSLLQEHLEFELARKPEVLTQAPEVTNEIEALIRQRVLDLNYDSVLPRRAVTETRAATSAEDFMDYDKSKKSLAELYEEDYKREVLHLPMQTEQEHAKKEATALFRKLCYNLDLLSNLTPAPKPKVQDIQVTSATVPALALEEKLPYHVSNEQTETFDERSVKLVGDTELHKSERASIHKRHKKILRTRKKEKIRRLMEKMVSDPRLGKFEYRTHLKEEKARKELIERKKTPHHKFTRSSEVFQQLKGLAQEASEPSKRVKL
jgi:U3 small nucleolar RNA-associated protein MPP10